MAQVTKAPDLAQARAAAHLSVLSTEVGASTSAAAMRTESASTCSLAAPPPMGMPASSTTSRRASRAVVDRLPFSVNSGKARAAAQAAAAAYSAPGTATTTAAGNSRVTLLSASRIACGRAAELWREHGAGRATSTTRWVTSPLSSVVSRQR